MRERYKEETSSSAFQTACETAPPCAPTPHPRDIPLRLEALELANASIIAGGFVGRETLVLAEEYIRFVKGV